MMILIVTVYFKSFNYDKWTLAKKFECETMQKNVHPMERKLQSFGMYIRWQNHKWNRCQCACVNTRAKHDKKISGMCIIPAMSADCVAGVWYTPYAYMKRTSKQHWNSLSFTLTRNEMDGNGMNLQLQVQHVLCFLDSDMDLKFKEKNQIFDWNMTYISNRNNHWMQMGISILSVQQKYNSFAFRE